MQNIKTMTKSQETRNFASDLGFSLLIESDRLTGSSVLTSSVLCQIKTCPKHTNIEKISKKKTSLGIRVASLGEIIKLRFDFHERLPHPRCTRSILKNHPSLDRTLQCLIATELLRIGKQS